jgi:hypothetical protein
MTVPLRRFLHLSRGERSDRSCDPGEGVRSCDPGEGVRRIERPYPLTPTLSPWERGYTDPAMIAFPFSGDSDHALPDGIRR